MRHDSSEYRGCDERTIVGHARSLHPRLLTDPAQPSGIENRAELLRKGDEPKVEAIWRRVKAMEREALHSHAMPDELARVLLMSTLRDCRRALDGKIAGATPQLVAQMLDSLSEWLTHSEIRAMRRERRSSS